MSNQPKQRIQVPDSLRDILLEFSIAYLLEQPGDVVDYAVEFFTKLQENRKSKISHDDVPPGSPDDESIMSLDEEPLVNRFATRRKSVFAETYDPENDADEDEGAAAIFPKSDEQRARLIESVKNILLFRSLDKEQMNQVLDAMFERKVSAGEIVIRQGDDVTIFMLLNLVNTRHLWVINIFTHTITVVVLASLHYCTICQERQLLKLKQLAIYGLWTDKHFVEFY